MRVRAVGARGMAGPPRDHRGYRGSGLSGAELRIELRDGGVRRLRLSRRAGRDVLVLLWSAGRRLRVSRSRVLQGRPVHPELRYGLAGDRPGLHRAQPERRLQGRGHALHDQQRPGDARRAVQTRRGHVRRRAHMEEPRPSLRSDDAAHDRDVHDGRRLRARDGRRIRADDSLRRARGRLAVPTWLPELPHVLRVGHRRSWLHSVHLRRHARRTVRRTVRKRHSVALRAHGLLGGRRPGHGIVGVSASRGSDGRRPIGECGFERRMRSFGWAADGHGHTHLAVDSLLHAMSPKRVLRFDRVMASAAMMASCSPRFLEISSRYCARVSCSGGSHGAP